MIDWLCFWVLMIFPCHRLNVDGRFSQFILPRAGNHVYGPETALSRSSDFILSHYYRWTGEAK